MAAKEIYGLYISALVLKVGALYQVAKHLKEDWFVVLRY